MFGANHSVSTLLKEEIPSIVTVKCSCHSANLVSCYASRKLPQNLEFTLREIFNHFSHSSARRREFSNFQEFANVKKHVIFSPGATRWLSLEACVRRILEQLEALELYFTAENLDHPQNQTVVKILDVLRERLTKIYLQFLAYLLNIINEFNTIHQQEAPQSHNLPARVDELIRDLALNFMHGNYVRSAKPQSIDPELTSQYLPLHKIYLGKIIKIK